MKAAIVREPGAPLTIEEVVIDAPGPREVLIRTKATGLCRSDMHFIEGTYPWPAPFIPGHEAAGVVEAVGELVSDVAVGDHVVTFLAPFCGSCRLCLNGQHTLCQAESVRRPADAPPRLSLAGQPLAQFLQLSAFAEQMLVHENACVAVSKDIPFDRAALIGCSVTTGSGAIFNECKLVPGESVAVVGCGGIGLSAINAAKIAGAGKIVAVDALPAKLELARKFGATHGYLATDPGVAETIVADTGGGLDYAIEAVGRTDTAQLAWSIVRRGGLAIVLGMIPPGEMVQIHGPEFLAGKAIKGSIMGGGQFKTDMPRLVDFYLAGSLDLDAIIAERFALADINMAVDKMHAGGDAVRSVIMFD